MGPAARRGSGVPESRDPAYGSGGAGVYVHDGSPATDIVTPSHEDADSARGSRSARVVIHRAGRDFLLWQAPLFSLAILTLLAFIALNGHSSPLARRVACALAITIVALDLPLLLMRRRFARAEAARVDDAQVEAVRPADAWARGPGAWGEGQDVVGARWPTDDQRHTRRALFGDLAVWAAGLAVVVAVTATVLVQTWRDPSRPNQLDPRQAIENHTTQHYSGFVELRGRRGWMRCHTVDPPATWRCASTPAPHQGTRSGTH